MDYLEFDGQLKDLLIDFEGALRAHLKTSEEFQTLVDYLAKKHGSISLYVAAQIMGAHFGAQFPKDAKATKKKVKKTKVPVRYEMTQSDLSFLRSLKINADI